MVKSKSLAVFGDVMRTWPELQQGVFSGWKYFDRVWLSFAGFANAHNQQSRVAWLFQAKLSLLNKKSTSLSPNLTWQLKVYPPPPKTHVCAHTRNSANSGVLKHPVMCCLSWRDFSKHKSSFPFSSPARSCWITRRAFSSFRSRRVTRSCFHPSRP